MHTQSNLKNGIRKTATCAVMGALLFVAQVVLSFLPNIEVVSLLTALYAVVFGLWALPSVFVFVLLQGLLYGFNIWWISYLYVWPILFLVSYLIRKAVTSSAVWAILLAFFGLLFGALCSIPYLVTGGISAAISWWIEGIPFDLLHCGGNFLTGLVLFTPLKKALERAKSTIWK